MSKVSKHIIQKQVLELTASGSKKSFEWDSHAEELIRTVLNPAIEECFDAFDAPGQHLIIERIEIDLGNFPPSGMAAELKKRLIDKMSRQLRDFSFDSTLDYQTKKNSADNPVYEFGKKQKTGNASMKLSKQSALFKALLEFFQTGKFPWWFSDKNRTIDLIDQFTQEWLYATNEEQHIELKELLVTSKAAMIRMVNHFTPEWISNCYKILGWKGEEGLKHWTLLSVIFKSFPELQFLFHQHFWIYWKEAVGANRDYPDMHMILFQIFKQSPQSALSFAKKLQVICKKHSAQPGFNFYEISVQKFLSVATGNLSAENKIDGKTVIAINQEDKVNELSKMRDEVYKAQKEKQHHEIEEEGLYLSCAGIVLLHPFLSELFTSTGLWSGGEWKFEGAPLRAIRLLSYLSYGNTQEPEFELALHKIIVGVPMETALPAAVPLTSEEQTTCDELLGAVIKHWQALKNTSAAGLQQAYLQRMGKLVLSEKGYVLHVERLAQDVLLAKLPWGFSTIKLPWMDRMMHVTWI
jgi:hypothetical protein